MAEKNEVKKNKKPGFLKTDAKYDTLNHKRRIKSLMV